MFTFDWKQETKKMPRISESGDPVLASDGTIEMYDRPPVFNGTVKVKIPKHQERMRFLKSLNLKVSSDGEVEKRDSFDMGDKIFDFVIQHIEAVDLVRVEDGTPFKSVEMLEVDSDGAEVLSDIGNALMKGVKLGKSSLKS